MSESPSRARAVRVPSRASSPLSATITALSARLAPVSSRSEANRSGAGGSGAGRFATLARWSGSGQKWSTAARWVRRSSGDIRDRSSTQLSSSARGAPISQWYQLPSSGAPGW